MTEGLVHAYFQLTGRCNLHCRFCGQSKGMLGTERKELSPEIWLNAADQLCRCAEDPDKKPTIQLWGGEPLLYPEFDRLAHTLHEQGFPLEMVTNGTLLHLHCDTVAECIDQIYVSVDGMEEIHDSVRGKGTFRILRENLKLLKNRRGKLNFLVTVSDCNVKNLSRLPFDLAELGPDRIVLSQLMYLFRNDIDSYREYSRSHFGCDYPELEAWLREDDSEYLEDLRRETEIIARTGYPVSVCFTPHAWKDHLNAKHCDAPFKRVHIRHDGEVGFCTDYFGFSAGNILKDSLENIFHGERAEAFRKAVCENALATCIHCPWRMQTII